MDKKQLEKYRNVLMEKKRTLLQKLTNASDDYRQFMENKGGDIADEATDAYERYLIYDLSVSEKQELDEINDAIHKIEDKEYGVCENCNEKIENKRLEAKPYAKYCIKCRELKEKENNLS